MKIRFMQALLGIILLMPTAAHAASEDVDVLVLEMADKTTKIFRLDDKPTISFAEGKLLVEAASVTTDFNQEDVTEFHFEKYSPATGIQAGKDASFSFVYNDNATVRISGTKARKAMLYTTDGQLVKSLKVNNGSVNVSLSSYQPGTYVLHLENDHTFKITKK